MIKLATKIGGKQQPRPTLLIVNLVIFTIKDSRLHVLLIRRKGPSKKSWALPGGFLNKNETSLNAAKRIQKNKAGVQNIFIEQLYTFDDNNLSPRERVISISYFAFIREDQIKLNADKKTQLPAFFPIKKLPNLAFDHSKIINYALKRLSAKLEYTNIVYALLPKNFIFSRLQGIYEAVWDKKLDKRNFRKKFMSLKLIKPTRKILAGNRQRPARLYQFLNRKPHELKKFF